MKIPVSVVGKFHLISLQLGQQQHQDLDKYDKNDLQHKYKLATFNENITKKPNKKHRLVT